MTKRIPIILSLITVMLLQQIFFFPVKALAQKQQINLPAKSAILIDADSGRVLYEDEADEPMPPASITKLMTLFLSFEALNEGRANMDDLVTVSQNAWETGGAQMFLNIGEQVSFRDLLTGIAVVSANDACVSVAEHLAGSVEVFVNRMNEKARELGLENTHYVDPSGLSNKNKMSARDIAVLSRQLIINFPELRELDTIPSFEHNGISQNNRNPLLNRYPGTDGLKTGYTEEAGYCLAATAVQDDMRLIAVSLGSASPEARLEASKGLLDYGFSNFQKAVLGKEGEVVAMVPVKSGTEREIEAALAADLEAVIPFGESNRIETSATPNEGIEATVKKGEKLGTFTAY